MHTNRLLSVFVYISTHNKEHTVSKFFSGEAMSNNGKGRGFRAAKSGSHSDHFTGYPNHILALSLSTSVILLE